MLIFILCVVVLGPLPILIGSQTTFESGAIAFGIALIAVMFLSWITGFVAKRHVNVLTSKSPQEIAAAVRDHFKGMGWKQIDGRGTLNYSPRGPGLNISATSRPVVSIDIETAPDGATNAEIWMSEWGSKFGMIGGSERVIEKVWTLKRRLLALDPAPAAV